MITYTRVITFIIICFFVIYAAKKMLIYHPCIPNPIKYHIFYELLEKRLVSSPDLVQNFSVMTPDGISLDTVYVKNPNVDLCMIYFHGNAGNISMRYDMIKVLYNFSSVIIFDYRHYGKSSGTIFNLSCDGLCLDARSIWDHVVRELGYHPNNISLFGESLGCAIAISLASSLSKTHDITQYPHSIILNSPFYSLSSMVSHVFDKFNLGFVGQLLMFLSYTEYNSAELIKYINHTTKIIIAHSPNDEVVPYTEGRQLYDTISLVHPNIQFIDVTGTHNNLGLTNKYIYALSDILYDA